jgi:hypothetical protein
VLDEYENVVHENFSNDGNNFAVSVFFSATVHQKGGSAKSHFGISLQE